MKIEIHKFHKLCLAIPTIGFDWEYGYLVFSWLMWALYIQKELEE